MTKKELLLEEIERIPGPLLEEVLDFVRFIEKKVKRRNFETAIASESSLKRDWLRPEEDKAWRNL